MDVHLESPIHGHIRYLLDLKHLPEQLQAVAELFGEAGWPLAHEDAESFETLMGYHPARTSLKETIEGLPLGSMRDRARAKVERARAEVRCGDFAEALHLLIEAQDCAVRALV